MFGVYVSLMFGCKSDVPASQGFDAPHHDLEYIFVMQRAAHDSWLASLLAGIKVPAARPAGNGGLLGEIPINYWNAKKRTGFYYLPKVRLARLVPYPR